MRAKILILIIIALTFVTIDIGPAREYYAVWHADNCRLEPKGELCFNIQNAQMEIVTDPKTDWTDESAGIFLIASTFEVGTACVIEGAYDIIKGLNTQKMYLDLSRGYSDQSGTHAFYKDSTDWLEVLIESGEPIPQYVLVDSDQCNAPVETKSTTTTTSSSTPTGTIPGMTQDNTIFLDDFGSNLDKWISFGNPSPQVLGSAEGRSGVFDNNGDRNCDSGVVSKDSFSLLNGFTLESDIFLRVTNPAGCWNDAFIGLTKDNSPALNSLCAVPRGLLFRIFFVGDACWQDPVDKMRHAYLDGGFYTEDGAWESIGSYVNADAYIDGWHKLKSAVGEDRYVKFYVDDILIYSSANKIDPAVLEGKKIILDGRSSGSAGKVYHDYVKLSGQSGAQCNPPCQSQFFGDAFTKDGTIYREYKDCRCVDGECQCENADKEWVYPGNVEISDLGMASGVGYEIIATDSTGGIYQNARVYVDNELVGRTDSEGKYISYGAPLKVGSHAIVVEYDPLPSGDTPDFTIPDIGAYIRNAMMLPGSENTYSYAGYVHFAGNPQMFTVKLNMMRQDKDFRDYEPKDYYDWVNFFANIIPTPGYLIT